MHITWSQVSWIHELRENLPNFVWVTINLSPWSLPSIAPHGAWSGGSPGARTDTGPPSYSLFIGLRPLTTQPYKYTPWGFYVYHGHSLCNFFYHCYVHINKHWVPKKFCTACIDWQYWSIFVFGKQYDLMLTSWVRFLWNWETTENVNNLHKDNDQDVRSYWRLFKTLKFVFYNYKIKRSFFLVKFEVKFVSILTTHEVGNRKIMIEISNHT